MLLEGSLLLRASSVKAPGTDMSSTGEPTIPVLIQNYLQRKFFLTFVCQGELYMKTKLLGIIGGFDQLLIKYSTLTRYWRKYGSTVVLKLFID
jgi:hypothetical protein